MAPLHQFQAALDWEPKDEPHPVPFPFYNLDFVAGTLGTVLFLPGQCVLFSDSSPSRPFPSPCPHSSITLSFLPFAASCLFDALMLSCVCTFPSPFPLF